MLDTEAKDGLDPSDPKTPDEIPSKDGNVSIPENASENLPDDARQDSTPNTPGNDRTTDNLPEDVRESFTPNTPESIRIMSSSPDPLLWLEELEQKVDCDLQSLIYNNEAGIPYRIPFIDAAVLEKVFSWEFQNDLDAFLSNGEDSLHIATAHLIHCASGGENPNEWCDFSERDANSLNNNADDTAHSNTTP